MRVHVHVRVYDVCRTIGFRKWVCLHIAFGSIVMDAYMICRMCARMRQRREDEAQMRKQTCGNIEWVNMR